MITLDAYQGCIIGGAIGDAFGYPIEFMDLKKIKNIYGESGLTHLIKMNGKAKISDDTQMTLFTANGLLIGQTRANMRGISGTPEFYVYKAYKEWIETQTGMHPKLESQKTWLYNINELHESRAPGRTCMFGVAHSETGGTIEKPLNDSKGCGGVMRVAPMALIYGGKDLERTMDASAKIAALTHGHSLGYIPAATLSAIVFFIIFENMNIENAVNKAMAETAKVFCKDKHWKYFESLISKAINLSHLDMEDSIAIEQLGEGWVAEETLAIAVYSSVKHNNNFMEAMICATNHDGDSDSTGAVTGNMLGAFLGLKVISQHFDVNEIELSDVILEITEDLYNGCPMHEYGDCFDLKWEQKYIEATYKREGE